MATWWDAGTNCAVSSAGRARKKRARQIRDNPALIRRLSRDRLLMRAASCRLSGRRWALIAGRVWPGQMTGALRRWPAAAGRAGRRSSPTHLQVLLGRRRTWFKSRTVHQVPFCYVTIGWRHASSSLHARRQGDRCQETVSVADLFSHQHDIYMKHLTE